MYDSIIHFKLVGIIDTDKTLLLSQSWTKCQSMHLTYSRYFLNCFLAALTHSSTPYAQPRDTANFMRDLKDIKKLG